jgi:hypothetical protein
MLIIHFWIGVISFLSRFEIRLIVITNFNLVILVCKVFKTQFKNRLHFFLIWYVKRLLISYLFDEHIFVVSLFCQTLIDVHFSWSWFLNMFWFIFKLYHWHFMLFLCTASTNLTLNLISSNSLYTANSFYGIVKWHFNFCLTSNVLWDLIRLELLFIKSSIKSPVMIQLPWFSNLLWNL